MIIKAAERIFNSDKICHSYSDLNFIVTFFGTQCTSSSGGSVSISTGSCCRCSSSSDVKCVNLIASILQHHYMSVVCIHGSLYSAANFTFESHRYHTSPFSLTLYVNGKQDCRLSVCCEYKHKAGGRLGGKSGHFGIVKVEGSSPCYRLVNICYSWYI